MAPRSGLPATPPSQTVAGTGADNAPIARLKHAPYYPHKPSRDPEVNLNGEVYFPGHEGNDDELVSCRHLAIAWLLQHESGSGKPDYQAFASKEAIVQNVPRSFEDLYQAHVRAASDVSIIGSSDWGKFAAERFRELERSGADSTRMVIEIGAHALSAEFRIKRAAGEPPQYMQKVYDPNVTLTHMRASTTDLSHVQAGKIEHFLTDGERAQTYRHASSFLVRCLPASGLASLVDVPAGGPADRRVAGNLPPLDVTVMHHLIADGFGGSLRDAKASIVRLAAGSSEDAFDLLSARNLVDDTPALFAAVVKGMSDGTAAFCEVVRECALDREQTMDLLAGQDADGTPALYIGTQLGCAEAVHALVKGIAASQLSAEHQAELLAARADDGTPALFVGMQVGQGGACRALINGILDLDLDARLRARLLMAPIHPGIPALSAAMERDSHEAVRALVDGLERSDLPAPLIAALLNGRRPDGVSALVVGMQRGQDDASRVLLDGITGSTKLSVPEKFHLLSAPNPLGMPAQSVAMLSDRPGCVTAFFEVVAGSGLPLAAKRELLHAVTSNGVPGLALAMDNDRSDSVRAFAEAVLSADLPNALKVELLRSERQGATAYQVALAQGCDSAAAALREVVIRSSLSPAEQAQVLDDASRRRRGG